MAWFLKLCSWLGRVAARGDDLKDAVKGVAGIPEGVPLIRWLEDKLADAGIDHFLAELGTRPTLDHVAVLVFAGMAVKRRTELVRRNGMLDEGDPPPDSSPQIMNRTPHPPRSPV